ncbi:MAG: hypothetical protein N4A74_26145 [Carboxylicivirga sp.]|jgi:succinate dehydrogenase flavin-adding protein (antitoxin of CptAB toxin-antitoxin module)|nr:hypothetical protein [Carboxylicivirga sp.]
MTNIENFQPRDEEEKKWVEYYNQLSEFISQKIRGLDEKDRLTTLRDLNQTDPSLMNLYLQSLKKEDYETSAVAKIILEERGYKIPS